MVVLAASSAGWGQGTIGGGIGTTGSGVDSTTYTGDSAFVWSGGTDYFTGITDAPRPNNGRVWYVAINGDNSNCVVGDPTLPCRHIWAVADSVQTNDVVVVTSGTYTIGGSGSGADYIIASTGGNLFRNGVDSINWHFEAGAIIKSVGPITCRLFHFNSTTSDVFFRVSGYGEFLLNGQFCGSNLTTNTYRIDANIKANRIRAGFNTFQHDFDEIIIDVENLDIYYPGNDGPGFIFGYLSTTATNLGRAMVSVNVRNAQFLQHTTAPNIYLNNWNLFQTSRLTKGTVSVTVDNLLCPYKVGGLIHSSPGYQADSTTVTCTINNLRVTDHLMGVSYGDYGINETTFGIINANATGGKAYSDSTGIPVLAHNDRSLGGTGNGNHFNLNIGNCFSHSPFFGQSNTGWTVNINVDNFSTNKSNPAIINAERASGTNTSPVYYNVKNCNTKAAAILETIKRPQHYITGRFKSSSGPVILYTDDNLTTNTTVLDGVFVVSSPSVSFCSPITATNARSYNLFNCFTNSTTIDSDVTELVQPIVRNTNVK